MNQTSVKTRRKFDETFKREAVNNWQICRSLDDAMASVRSLIASVCR
jgi:hypothetical protein